MQIYEPWHCISKADIDSFITASDKTIFAERILVSVADDWGRNAENAIKGLHVPCRRMTINDMEKSPINWSAFDPKNPDNVNYLPQKQPRQDQIEAINAVMNGFKIMTVASSSWPAGLARLSRR